MLLNLIGGDCYFIFDSGFLGEDEYNKESCNYISNMGLIYSESIMPLIECVLLSVDNCVATDFKTNNIMEIYNQEIICLIISDKPEGNHISFEPYVLTKSGIELYNIIKRTSGFKTNTEYPVHCFRELRKNVVSKRIAALGQLNAPSMAQLRFALPSVAGHWRGSDGMLNRPLTHITRPQPHTLPSACLWFWLAYRDLLFRMDRYRNTLGFLVFPKWCNLYTVSILLFHQSNLPRTFSALLVPDWTNCLYSPFVSYPFKNSFTNSTNFENGFLSFIIR